MREMADTRGLKLNAAELGRVEPIRRALNEQQVESSLSPLFALRRGGVKN